MLSHVATKDRVNRAGMLCRCCFVQVLGQSQIQGRYRAGFAMQKAVWSTSHNDCQEGPGWGSGRSV